MKKKLTIIFIIVFLASCILFIYEKIYKKDTSFVEQQTKKDEVTTELAQEGLSSMDYRGCVDQEQIYELNDTCIAEDSTTKTKYEFQVLSCSTSKSIVESIKNKIIDYDSAYKNTLKKYEENTFNNDGTIVGSYSYLFVEISITNIGKDVNMFAPLTFNLNEISQDVITSYGSGKYEQANYISDNDGKINYMKVISPFRQGDSGSFTLIYIIPDELIGNYDLCINYGFGKYGKQLIIDKLQKYVKLYY